jgi:hypothetical protein
MVSHMLGVTRLWALAVVAMYYVGAFACWSCLAVCLVERRPHSSGLVALLCVFGGGGESVCVGGGGGGEIRGALGDTRVDASELHGLAWSIAVASTCAPEHSHMLGLGSLQAAPASCSTCSPRGCEDHVLPGGGAAWDLPKPIHSWRLHLKKPACAQP